MKMKISKEVIIVILIAIIASATYYVMSPKGLEVTQAFVSVDPQEEDRSTARIGYHVNVENHSNEKRYFNIKVKFNKELYPDQDLMPDEYMPPAFALEAKEKNYFSFGTTHQSKYDLGEGGTLWDDTIIVELIEVDKVN